MKELRDARHALERGSILLTLAADYRAEMTSVRNLIRALDAQGIPLSEQGIEFHLVDLAQRGYVRIWRAKDMPGFRRDRPARGATADTVMFAKLLPLGLDLIDGRAPEDASVAF